MALRRLASQTVQSLGVRAPVTAFELTLRGAACRAYCAVVDGLKYAKSHEWAKVDGDTATVGITEFAQTQLGDVVYVELPELGAQVKKGDPFGVVESVKAASDVYSPVSGEVMDVNNNLVDEPGKVNEEPFAAGWIMKVKLSNPGELSELMDSAGYLAYLDASHP